MFFLLEIEEKSGYADEIYLPINTTYSSILDDIVVALSVMDVGEVAMLDDENGSYYLFCKYAPVDGAYEEEALATWFSGFSDGITNALFEEVCKVLFPYITVDEEVFANAPAIRNMEPNYYY